MADAIVTRFRLKALALALAGVSFISADAPAHPWITEDLLPFQARERMSFDDPVFGDDTGELAVESFKRAIAATLETRADTPVIQAVVEDVADYFDGAISWLGSPERELVYNAAIAADDCAKANDLLWEGLVSSSAYFSAFRHGDEFNRYLRWGVLGKDPASREPFEDGAVSPDAYRYLAACLSAQEAAFFNREINRWAAEAGEPDIVRPFVDYPGLVAAERFNLHTFRDGNYWHLIHMATQGESSGYGPAGLMFVELALELESINVADDILHMLLLRADATWPEPDPERPLPVSQDRIAELLPITRARLDADRRANAERCFMTDEVYDRLFGGEAAYLARDESACTNK